MKTKGRRDDDFLYASSGGKFPVVCAHMLRDSSVMSFPDHSYVYNVGRVQCSVVFDVNHVTRIRFYCRFQRNGKRKKKKRKKREECLKIEQLARFVPRILRNDFPIARYLVNQSNFNRSLTSITCFNESTFSQAFGESGKMNNQPGWKKDPPRCFVSKPSEEDVENIFYRRN